MSKGQKILSAILIIIVFVTALVILGYRVKIHSDIINKGQVVEIMWLNDKYHVMPNTQKHVSQDAIIVSQGDYYGYTVERINVDRFAVHPHGLKSKGYVYGDKFVLVEDKGDFFSYTYVKYLSYNEKYL